MSFIMLCFLSCRDEGTKVENEAEKDPYDVQVGPYDADIRWTSYGIPHILAEDYGSMGYGLGYAFAQDHYCLLIDQVIRTQGERARYFGSDYVDQDFGWKALGVLEQAERGWFELPEEIQATLIGYAAGYNRYRAEHPDGLAEWCLDAPYLRDLNHIDLLAYYNALSLKASGENFVTNIGEAVPPSWPNRPAPPEMSSLDWVHHPEFGSNGWALGRDKTENGRGMLLSNTHFPYRGERMWHEVHLTIPGELNVYGASLMGVPVVNIGFNEQLAWTHTVSTNPRFVVYTLPLVDGDPTTYLYDGVEEEMSTHEFTVDVLQSDGTIQTETRELYRSRYGWMINAPSFGWPDTVGFTVRDINRNNTKVAGTWLDMNRAQNLEDFQSAIARNMGIPWVHTMATDTSGNVWYADAARTPHFSPAAEDYFVSTELQANPFSNIFYGYGVIAVSGDNPIFELDQSHPDGIVPFEEVPKQSRTDYVLNANDNHWLGNHLEPLTGYSFVFGAEDSPRTPRTRMNLRHAMNDGGSDGLFSLEELQQTALSGRASLAEDLREAVVERCTGVGLFGFEYEGESYELDLTEGCQALSEWDGTTRVDARGAHLWRELLGAGVFDFDDLLDAGELYGDDFDAQNPIYSPMQLAAPPENRSDPILVSLGLALERLSQAGISPTARLGDIQFQKRDGQNIPIMGHSEYTGGMAIAEYSGGNASLHPKEDRAEVINSTSNLTTEGYQINYGNSWIMTVSFTDTGPKAQAIMTYSQSSNPDSAHFEDQSWLYANSEFRDVLFTEAEIAADLNLQTLNLILE